MNFCGTCGARVTLDSKFCSACGTAVAPPAGPVDSAPTGGGSPPPTASDTPLQPPPPPTPPYAAPAGHPAQVDPPHTHTPRARRGRGKWLVTGIVTALLLIAAGAGATIWFRAQDMPDARTVDGAQQAQDKGTDTNAAASDTMTSTSSEPTSSSGQTTEHGLPAGTALVSGGQFGDGLEITPDGGYLFFSRKGAVSFIDTSNNVVSGSFGSPARPEDIAFSPDGRRAYMADSFESTISVVDLTDGGATSARINVADFHYQKRVAVAPDGLRVYATDSYGDKLSVIDTATNSVVGVVNFAQQAAGAWDVAVTASAGRAFVTRPGVDAVEVIDTSSNSLEKTLSVGSYPRGIVMSPDGHRAYVANFSSGSVSVIDTSSAEAVATIAGVGSSPDMIAVSRDGARVFVVSQELDSDTISVIDTTTNTVEKSLHMGTDLTAIAAHPDGHRVYVIDRGYGTLSIVDTNADG